MNPLCIIFGHRITDRILPGSSVYADNVWCARCKRWSFFFPGNWHDKYGNGVIPETLELFNGLLDQIIAHVQWICRVISK